MLKRLWRICIQPIKVSLISSELEWIGISSLIQRIVNKKELGGE